MKVEDIKKVILSDITILKEDRVLVLDNRRTMQACASIAADAYINGTTPKFGIVCRDDRNVMGFYSLEKESKYHQVVVRSDIGEDELKMLLDKMSKAINERIKDRLDEMVA